MTDVIGLTPVSINNLGTGPGSSSVQQGAAATLTDLTLTGVLSIGTGDSLSLFFPTEAQYVKIKKGTIGAPDTVAQPLVKIERTILLLASQTTSGEATSPLAVIARAVPGNEVQVQAGSFIAESRSDTQSVNNDVAASVHFATWDLTSPPLQATGSISHGIEASYHASRNTGSPFIAIDTIEVQSQNYYGRNSTALTITSIVGNGVTTTVTVAESPSRVNKSGTVTIAGTGNASWDGHTFTIASITGLSTFTFASSVNDSQTTGTATTPLGDAWNDNGSVSVWSAGFIFAASGKYRSAAAFQFNRPAGLPTFHVGILVPGFVATGDGRGPVDYATFLDDGKADYSILIQKPHSRAAISVLSGAGPVVLGNVDLATIGTDAAGATFAVNEAAGSTAHPIIYVGTQSGGNKSHYITFENQSGTLQFYVSGAASAFQTGDTQGTVGFKLTKAGKTFKMGGTTGGVVFEFTEDGKIGFNNATPVTKPTVTGSRGGNAALASLLTQLATRGDLTDSTTA